MPPERRDAGHGVAAAHARRRLRRHPLARRVRRSGPHGRAPPGLDASSAPTPASRRSSTWSASCWPAARSSCSAPRTRSRPTCPRPSRASGSGASCSPSPAPAPTWPACRRGPSSTATPGSSTARRCGARAVGRRDWGILLARTEPDGAASTRASRSSSSTCPAPGVETRPLRQMTGDAEFDEVFLTDVRLPADALLGERGQGWEIAMSALTNERGHIGGMGRAITKRLEAMQALAAATAASTPVAPATGSSQLYVRGRAYLAMTQRQGPTASVGSSLGKLGMTGFLFDLAELRTDIAGADGMLAGPDVRRPARRARAAGSAAAPARCSATSSASASSACPGSPGRARQESGGRRPGRWTTGEPWWWTRRQPVGGHGRRRWWRPRPGCAPPSIRFSLHVTHAASPTTVDPLVGDDELEPLGAVEEREPRRRHRRPAGQDRPPGMDAWSTRSVCSQTSDMASRSRASNAA